LSKLGKETRLKRAKAKKSRKEKVPRASSDVEQPSFTQHNLPKTTQIPHKRRGETPCILMEEGGRKVVYKNKGRSKKNTNFPGMQQKKTTETGWNGEKENPGRKNIKLRDSPAGHLPN